LVSVNKSIKYIFFFMDAHLFYIYILFYWAGPAKPMWVRLDPASPARSLAQAGDPAGQKPDARLKHLHACMNSAKAIKLPSHSVLAPLEFQRM